MYDLVAQDQWLKKILPRKTGLGADHSVSSILVITVFASIGVVRANRLETGRAVA